MDLEFKGSTAFLKLNQPPNNELGVGMINDLRNAIDKIIKKKPRSLIIYSTLENCFSSGADLKQFHEINTYKKINTLKKYFLIRKFINIVHRLFNKLDCLPLISIVVIEGICFGGGLELALTGDFIIADRRARFAFPELRLGIIPAFGGIPRIERVVGNLYIRDLIFSGRTINANKASQIGLVTHLVAEGHAFQAAVSLSEQINKFDPSVVQIAKKFVKPFPNIRLNEEKKIFLGLSLRKEFSKSLKRYYDDKSNFPYLS